LPLLQGNIKAENLGGGFYQLDFPAITDTNGTVTTNHEIPFPHRIYALYIKHTDPNGADESTDTLTFSAKFGLRQEVQPFSMSAFSLSTKPDEAFLFPGSEAIRNACSYEFKTTETVDNNLVYISMIVQVLGEI
jgi:hypothetical protein